MTRDEAAKVVRDTSFMDGPAGDDDLRKKWSETMVDTLAALGLLKLDETTDIIVACVCGWQGRQSELNGNLCPKCSAPFKAVP